VPTLTSVWLKLSVDGAVGDSLHPAANSDATTDTPTS
jgi:hypothetical protein